MDETHEIDGLPIRALIAILLTICVPILVVVGLGLYIVYDMGIHWQREVDRFAATVPLGITMEEVRALHGEPLSVTQPHEPTPSHADLMGSRQDDPTTVWFYWLGDNGYLDAAYLFFDDDGKLVRVELIYT